MKIAFLISAHTDPQHLLRLTEQLPEDSETFVHVDLKSNLQEFRATVTSPRVHFIEERYDVMWASMQQVKFQRALVKEALSFGIHFDYLFTLSGLDYPVWSNQRITDYLTQHKGQEFIQGICMEHQQGIDAKQYQEYRFLNNHAWRYGTLKSKFRVSLRKISYALGIRKKLYIPVDGQHYALYKGADWWGITSELAAYCMDFMDSHSDFVHYFNTSFCPSETIWQTIAFQSPFAPRCILSEGAFTRLEDYTPLTYIEYGEEIKILTEADYDAILKSGKMFCRKTITGRSDKLMDMIDEQRHDG